MAFVHGKNTRMLINEFNLSAYLNNIDMARDADTPETTVYEVDDRTYIAGLRNATLSLSGFVDLGSDASDEVLSDTLGVETARIVTLAQNGLAVGEVVYMFQTHSTSYSPSSPVDGVVSFSADVQSTGQVDRGVSLHNISSEGSSANGTSVDNSASSSNGGVGHLHVSVAGGSTLDVDIEDSSDDMSFSSLISFTQVTTTATSQRSTVAGTVERYVRAAWTIAGGSYTFSVAFARR